MAYVTKQDNLLPQQQGPGFAVFDENDPKYRCCCGGKCHSRTGALIIGILALLGCWSIAGQQVQKNQQYGNSQGIGYMIGSVIFSIINLIAVIMLIYGVLKERAKFMIPYMVIHVLQMVLLGIIMILVIVAMTGVWVVGFLSAGKSQEDAGKSQEDEINDLLNRRRDPVSSNETTVKAYAALFLAVILVIFVLAMIFSAWFLTVLLKCYRYLSDKQAVFVPVAQHY